MVTMVSIDKTRRCKPMYLDIHPPDRSVIDCISFRDTTNSFDVRSVTHGDSNILPSARMGREFVA